MFARQQATNALLFDDWSFLIIRKNYRPQPARLTFFSIYSAKVSLQRQIEAQVSLTHLTANLPLRLTNNHAPIVSSFRWHFRITEHTFVTSLFQH